MRMGSALVIRERRILKDRAGVPTGALSGPPRRRRSARSFRRSGERRRRRRRLALFLALLFVFGVGYSIVGLAKGRTAISVGPHAPAENLSKDESRKTSYPSSTTCDDLGVLVDRSHSLPPDYAPKDLVPLREYGISTLGSEVLRREAAERLRRLVEVAAADGEKLAVASAYRSYEEQQRSYRSLAGVLGADAGRLSAAPGHSQHQLGTAVDFTNAEAGYKLETSFSRTSASQWLEHHAWEYGFVLAYPRGEEERTGYRWEPWHYRYVGVRDAKRIEDSGQSLQEFLESVETTPRC
jgi:LAS superfamily LD-carboxypeptidase LdcB